MQQIQEQILEALKSLKDINKQQEKTDLKIDLMFGMLSNQILANQAVESANNIHQNPDKITEKETEFLKQLQEIHKAHNTNLSDSINYFIKLFGVETNAKVEKIMQNFKQQEMIQQLKKSEKEKNETQPDTPEITDVKVESTRTSEVVESCSE